MSNIKTPTGAPVKKEKPRDVSITRRGKEIVLPDDPAPMPISDAIKWLTVKQEQEEKIVQITETIHGHPLDCAHAMGLAVQELFGFQQNIDTQTFFGSKPPLFISVPVDHLGNTVQVFCGKFRIPGTEDAEWNTYASDVTSMTIDVTIRQKYSHVVKKLAEKTREVLQEKSIYRGKAVTISFVEEDHGFFGKETKLMPQFIPPYVGVRPRLRKHIMDAVEAQIWERILHPDACIAAGVPLKCGALLAGKYGTGKSLIARVTADLCVQNGWTFLYCDSPDALMQTYDLARVMKNRCVIFCEDMDVVVKSNDVNQLQNLLDGVDTKNLDIILVLTTNHPDEIPPGLLRDGRIDSVIMFEPPDAATVEVLIQDFAGANLAPGQDLTECGKILEGNIPAIIHGVVKTAKLHALRLSGGTDPRITTEAILEAAANKQAQIEMVDRQAPKKQSAMEQFGGVVGKYIAYAVAEIKDGRGAASENNITEHNKRNNVNGRATVRDISVAD